MAQDTNTAEVREVIYRWAKAVRDGDMDGVLAGHTDDVLMYDVVPPQRIRGEAEYRKQWELFFQYSPGGEGSFELIDVEIFASDTVAYCTALLGIVTERCRLTLGLRKVDGKWLIAHEHHSFPGDLGDPPAQS
ncbi:YybH family protein [Actinomadura flavalba]|uniref:YybH family protein n=1 Tax=Actinomadura flavalba TaxID=1120938 RepID=UPI00036D7404|nr:nuclear transport factor 2 family protein [Actinomadura flavalba]